METSLKMKPKLENLVPVLHKTRARQNNYKIKIKIITCRYKAMQEKKTNLYHVLSLESQNVGFCEIKKAYRNMALQYHPDVCPPSAKEESTKRFVELRQAYETLSDPISRRLYDYELSLGNSTGFDIELRMEERNNKFPKEAWEEQLHGLKQRSHVRLEKMNNKYI